MDPILEVAVFLVLPYVALAALVGGVAYRLYRWLSARSLTGLRSVAVVPNTFRSSDVTKDLVKRVFTFYTFSNMETDRSLYVGSLLFHYGIAVVLVSHLALVVPVPISPQLHAQLALYLGGASGLVALAGLLILLFRRTGVPRMRQISFFGDYFAVALLLGIIGFGLLQTLVVRPDYMDTVSPWLVSILSFRPNLAPIANVGPFTVAHVALALVFIGYVPYGKMVHMFAYLANPTIVRTSAPVGVLRPSARSGLWPAGAEGDPPER